MREKRSSSPKNETVTVREFIDNIKKYEIFRNTTENEISCLVIFVKNSLRKYA